MTDMMDMKARSLAILDMCLEILKEMSPEEIQARLKETGLDKYVVEDVWECPPHHYEFKSSKERISSEGTEFKVVVKKYVCAECGKEAFTFELVRVRFGHQFPPPGKISYNTARDAFEYREHSDYPYITRVPSRNKRKV